MAGPQVSIGQRAKALLLTEHYGPVRTGLLKSADLTPDVKQTSVPEIDNVLPGKIYNVHLGGSWKLSQLEKNELEIMAAIMDLEPTISPAGIRVDHTRLGRFHLVLNRLGDDIDRVFSSQFGYGCRTQSASTSTPADDATMREISGRLEMLAEVRGMAMRYGRARSSTVQTVTPAQPTLTSVAAATTLVAADLVFVRVASCSSPNTALSPAPTVNELLTRATAETSIRVGTATNKVVVTLGAPVPGGASAAVYVSRNSGEEVFAGWIAAAGTTFDVTTYPDSSNPPPPRRNTTGAFPRADTLVTDMVFGAVGGFANAVDLLASAGQIPQFLLPDGVPYVAVLKNGILQPEKNQVSGFAFSPTGQYFYLTSAPAPADVWELILPIIST